MTRPHATAFEQFQHSDSPSGGQHLSRGTWDNVHSHCKWAFPEVSHKIDFQTSDLFHGCASACPPLDANQIKSVLQNAKSLNFTSPAQDAQSGKQPDFFLSADGKLIANPKAKPSADGSVTIELQTKNKNEVDAKKVADQLQKATIKDLINYFKQSHPAGTPIPEDWLNMLNKEPDLPPPPVPLEPIAPPTPIDPPAPAPAPTPEPQVSRPQPQTDAPSVPSGSTGSGGGGGGGYSGGGGGDGGGYRGGGSSGGGDAGSFRPVSGSDHPPSGDSGLNVPQGNGQGMDHLLAAIDRANHGGKPVSVLQYGDSHIVQGTEANTIDSLLKGLAPTDYHTQAKVGISANYPLSDPQNWLDKPIQQANPDLVILSFGSNDSAGAVNKEQYEQTYQKLIDAVHQRAPNADILIVGPTDGDSITGANKGHTLPGLDTVVQAQREVAERNGLAFFDMRQAMGGPGSIETWHDQGLAGPDKLHLTNEGYQRTGAAIFQFIQKDLEAAKQHKA